MKQKPLFVRPTLRRILGAIICIEMAGFIVLGLGDEPQQNGCIVRVGWAVVAFPLIPILVGLASGLLLDGSRVNDWIEKVSRRFLLAFLILALIWTLRLNPFLLLFLIWALSFALRLH